MSDAVYLDTTGLKCPLPVLKAKKALKALQAGQVLEVCSTDPGSVQDFQHFCATAGHTLLDQSERDGSFNHRIQK